MDHDTPHAGGRTLAIASLAVFATFLDTTALFVAYGDIAASFPTVSSAELSWVLNGYTIAVAALLVPAGKLADRHGHKRTFLIGSIVFAVASVGCAAAPGVAALVAFRLVQAVGAAALVPSSFALVLRAVPAARVPAAIAVWGATGAVAGALGPTLAAALIEVASWRWVFLVNLPIGVVTVVLGRFVLRESRDRSARVPAAAGVVLIAGGAALLSLGVVQSDQWGWSDPRTLSAVAAGVVVLGAFVAHQRRTTAPVLDLELFRSGNFTWANTATVAFGLAFTAMFFGSILFLTGVWGWSTLSAGLGVSPGPLLVAALAPVIGRRAGRVGQRSLLVAGGVVFALGGVARLTMLDADATYVTGYLPSLVLTGLGVALCLPQLSSVVGQSLPPGRLAVGGAANQAIRQFGGTLGVALTIALLGAPTGLADALVRFDRVWWLLVLGGLATSALCLPLRTRPTPAAVAAGDATTVAHGRGPAPDAPVPDQPVLAPQPAGTTLAAEGVQP